MSTTVNLELDPIFLKGLGYLHSKSKDSAEKLKALLDESLARGSDSSYRSSQKEVDVPRVSVTKVSLSKPDSKSSSSSSSSSGINNGKSGNLDKGKKESEKRPSEKVKVDLGDGAEPAKKPRLEKQENRSSPITVQTSKDLALADLSSFDETSADDFAMEMGLACVVCRQMTVTSGNQLVECQECHNLYHQECHKPQVTDKDVNDPRLVWYCARCTRQMKRMAQKTQKPPQKAAPTVASAAPVVKDTLVKKSEVRPKQDTASTFQAFKRTEVKVSTTVTANPSASSSSIPSGSGLTGWAAFGAKTPAAGAASAKLGSALQSSSGKASTASSSQKPVGLSGLASAKPGLATKVLVGSSSSSEGSNPVPLKPPPPLILGKPGLNRSSSNDSVNKVGVAVPSSQTSGSGNGGPGGNGGAGSTSSGTNSNNNNGSKAAAEALAGGKAPTTQESQLNAMKRLQMVKKKAAQKKLKK
ncbi:integrator complex subunit 12-like [Megalops cyprinoides]|uniref:integrator complex subunit 12-like n=1 Tax=Megalops cyprinoides TaxID=118141 RepID=UPI0018655B41|nr:integrator complex subunit 12-like [Megalops cyprinoides]